ncbi:uncharacterized protein [Bemisia tabaci]|uniref:uncharacterized protein n=1 Tax=Bemisia tabaci TaxID=7038 RepID=UPI003B2835C3
MAPSTSGPGNDPGISATCPAAAPQPTSCPQRCPSTRSCPTPQPQQQPCQPCGSAAPGPSDCAIPIIEQATATVLTNIRVQRKLRFDWCYLTSKSGILKILEILVLILGLVAAHFYKELMKPFGYTAMVALVLTLLLLILYLIHFIEKFYTVPWLQTRAPHQRGPGRRLRGPRDLAHHPRSLLGRRRQHGRLPPLRLRRRPQVHRRPELRHRPGRADGRHQNHPLHRPRHQRAPVDLLHDQHTRYPDMHLQRQGQTLQGFL